MKQNAFPAPGTPPDAATNAGAAAAVAEQDRIERNISSLIAIPFEQCPWPQVRSRLLRLAVEGADIYAYTPFGSSDYVIYQWQEQPDMQCRFTPRGWASRYGYDVGEAQSPRFAAGQIVSWPSAHCAFRVDGWSTLATPPHTRFYGGMVVSGENIGGYVLSAPENELEARQEGVSEDASANA